MNNNTITLYSITDNIILERAFNKNDTRLRKEKKNIYVFQDQFLGYSTVLYTTKEQAEYTKQLIEND